MGLVPLEPHSVRGELVRLEHGGEQRFESGKVRVTKGRELDDPYRPGLVVPIERAVIVVAERNQEPIPVTGQDHGVTHDAPVFRRTCLEFPAGLTTLR